MMWSPPEEMQVCEFIIQSPYNSSVDLTAKIGNEFLEKFFKRQKSICLEWLEDKLEIFRLSPNKSKIFLCVKDIKPCLDYWSNSLQKPKQGKRQGCQGQCGHFHVCKQFLFDVTHSAFSCKQEHDFTSSLHNKSLVEKFSLTPLSTEQVKQLLFNSIPKVCTDYIQGECKELDSECQDLHICGDYVGGTCNEPFERNDKTCNLMHYEAICKFGYLFMESFHIPDIDQLKRNLVYFKPLNDEAAAKNDQSLEGEF